MIKRNIIFNEALHTYTDEDNNPYTSVTTLIGKVTPPFNREFWSKFKSDQTGIPQQDILDNWKDITDEACAKGNKEHKLLEDSIKSSYYEKKKLLTTALVPLEGKEFTNVNLDVLAQSELAKKYPDIFVYLRSKIAVGWKLYVEKRTYSYEHLVAGTIDCLLIKGKKFIIVDWKTNKKELKFRSGYYKKVGGVESSEWINTNQFLFPPVGYVEHCKGGIYTLQLSLYAYIVEMWGLVCEGLILFHIRGEDKPKSYDIVFDRSSAYALLKYNKNKDVEVPIQTQVSKFGIK